MLLIFEMSTRRRWRRRHRRRSAPLRLCAALEAGDRRVEARGREELDHAEDRRSIEAGLDVAAAAGVDLDVGIGEHAVWSAAPWTSAGSAPIDGFLARGRRTGPRRRRGRRPSPRAASSRRGSAWGRSSGAFLPAGRIMNSRCECARLATAPPIRPRIVPATTIAPALSGSSVYWFLPRCSTSEK